MAAVTQPVRRSLIGAVLAAWQSRTRKPLRISAAAAKVREHVLTVAALTAIDVGAFHIPGPWGTVAGCAVLGASMLVLDFAFTGR